MLIMLIGVWSLNNERKLFAFGIALTALMVILTTLSLFIDAFYLHLLNRGLLLIFCMLSVAMASQQILFNGRVSFNKLVGSICVYLLLGVIWALFYSFIDLLTANAFEGLPVSSDHQAMWGYIYFSFVTLTTLGYGDISPANEMARSFVYMEAIFGQFYIAILVASIVGSLISKEGK
ncbi:MAG: hypothetical protein JKX87_04760 [Cycloclasticus sp.]|nr:hypothetical protein [Cycloclasticus sp.]